MDDEEKYKNQLRDQEARRREWQRVSHNIIRIYNPLYIDFRFLHDGYPNTVKARSYKDIELFKARLYFRNISQYIINQMTTEKADELLKKRRDRGLDEILNKWHESQEIWFKTPRLNDPQLLRSIAEKVIIGLVEEYGKEEPLPEQRVQPKPDMLGLDEEVFKKIANREIPKEMTEEETPVKPLKKKGEQ